MRLRLLPTLALCSLAALAAVVAIWARSYWRQNIAYDCRGGIAWCVRSNFGRVELMWVRGLRHDDGFVWQDVRALPFDFSAMSRQAYGGWGGGLLGFGVNGWTGPPGDVVRSVQFPYGLPAALSLVAPALWWRRRHHQRVRGFAVEVAQDA